MTIDPLNTEAIYFKGLALDALGNHTEAIEYFDKAFSVLDPYSPLNFKGLALDALGNHTGAIIEYFEKILKSNPDEKACDVW